MRRVTRVPRPPPRAFVWARQGGLEESGEYSLWVRLTTRPWGQTSVLPGHVVAFAVIK